jgi:hypothetical protein
MSSLRDVPPVETMQFTFIYFPIDLTTEEVYNASSLVGRRINACI